MGEVDRKRLVCRARAWRAGGSHLACVTERHRPASATSLSCTSTMTSVDTSNPPAIRHAARTYGKPRKQLEEDEPTTLQTAPTRDAPPDDDGDANLNDESFSADASRSSLDHMLTSMPSSPAAGEIPPDSSDCDLSMSRDVEEDDDSDEKGGAVTSFGWKDRLKAMDSDDDFEDVSKSNGSTTFARVRRGVNAMVGNIYGKSPARPRRVEALELGDTHRPSHGDDEAMQMLDNSRSLDEVDIAPVAATDAYDEGTPSISQHDEPSSQPPQPRPSHAHARRAILDSDSDPDSGSNSRKPEAKPRDADLASRRRSVHGRHRPSQTRSDSSSPTSASPETSPGKLHHINTPNTSSRTGVEGGGIVSPPTSQEGLAMTGRTKKSIRRGRASITESEEDTDDSGDRRKASGGSLQSADFDGSMEGPRVKDKGKSRGKPKEKEKRVKVRLPRASPASLPSETLYRILVVPLRHREVAHGRNTRPCVGACRMPLVQRTQSIFSRRAHAIFLRVYN